ncbi:MAG: hypothetical protein ACI4OI_00045 [Gemmiger sp.]
MKRLFLTLLAALTLAASLSGCGFQDLMLYLYGGDEWVEEEKEPLYTRYDGENGVTVLYDANVWQAPTAPQADTISLMAGNQLSYTVVLLQVTDSYTDFLAQSGEELAETTNVVEKPLEFTVPDCTVQAALYDCGSYQTLLAQLEYDSGTAIYVTAATRSSDYSDILTLLQTVYPAGHAPEQAAALEESTAEGGAEKQHSYA